MRYTILQQAEAQFKKTTKKFGYSCKVWTLFAEFYFKRGDPESARALLPCSLQSLEKRKRASLCHVVLNCAILNSSAHM